MLTSNGFILENTSGKPVEVVVEPEGLLVHLGPDEKLTVEGCATANTIRIHRDPHTGNMMLAVWPGDNHCVVKKNGVDVLC